MDTPAVRRWFALAAYVTGAFVGWLPPAYGADFTDRTRVRFPAAIGSLRVVDLPSALPAKSSAADTSRHQKPGPLCLPALVVGELTHAPVCLTTGLPGELRRSEPPARGQLCRWLV